MCGQMVSCRLSHLPIILSSCVSFLPGIFCAIWKHLLCNVENARCRHWFRAFAISVCYSSSPGGSAQQCATEFYFCATKCNQKLQNPIWILFPSFWVLLRSLRFSYSSLRKILLLFLYLSKYSTTKATKATKATIEIENTGNVETGVYRE